MIVKDDVLLTKNSKKKYIWSPPLRKANFLT